MYKVIDYCKNKLGYKVKVAKSEDDIPLWLDIWTTDNKDIDAAWSQCAFDVTNAEDMIRASIQANVDEFDDAVSSAIAYLESIGEIWQNTIQEWFKKD